MLRNIRGIDFTPELEFKAIRSSGPGGQNVNKVNTQVELRFNVKSSNLLSEMEKALILKKLTKRISKEGIIILVSQTRRSQIQNKEESVKKFYDLIEKALKPVKKRVSTSPSYSSVLKRLERKKQKSEKKISRAQTIIQNSNN